MSTNGCAIVATSDNCALLREDEVLQPLLEVVNRYVPWTFCKASLDSQLDDTSLFVTCVSACHQFLPCRLFGVAEDKT